MTGRYVTTETSIYTDPDLRHWRPLSIYFYRYLYENEHVHGVSGIGRIAEDVIRNETRLTKSQVERAREDIAEKVRWFDDGTYWVVGRAKHTCYTGQGRLHPKFVASARNYLDRCPPDVATAFGRQYPDIITDRLPIERQPVAEPTLPTVAVAVAVAEAVADLTTAGPVKDQGYIEGRENSENGDWQAGDYETVVASVPKVWRLALLEKKRRTGFTGKYPPSWVLAGLTQIRNAGCKDPTEAVKRTFGLLKTGPPKDSLLDAAKKLLQKERRKNPQSMGALLKGE